MDARKSWLANVLLIVAATLFAVGLVELLCRTVLTPPGTMPYAQDYVPGLFVADPDRGYAYRKGFHGRQTSSDYDVDFVTDELGLRTASKDEADQPVAAGEWRILAIGDSFTTGLGNEYRQAWPEQLEKIFAASDDGRVVRVFNAGVDGYNVRQMRKTAAQLIPVLEPDLLAVGLYVDGFQRMWHPFVLVGDHIVGSHMADRVELGDNEFYYSTFGQPRLVRIDLWLTKHFHAGAYALEGLNSLRRRAGEEMGDDKRSGDPQKGLTPMLQELLQLNGDAEARSIPMVVMLIGSQADDRGFRDSTLERHGIAREFCSEHGLLCFDAMPALMAAAQRGEYLRFEHDGHWNATANEIAARALASNFDLLSPRPRIGRSE